MIEHDPTKEPPKRLWLQWSTEVVDMDQGVTWCQDPVNDDDTEYFRADFVEGLQKERDKLRDEIEDWKVASLLGTDGDDPSGVKPKHLEKMRQEDERIRDRLARTKDGEVVLPGDTVFLPRSGIPITVPGYQLTASGQDPSNWPIGSPFRIGDCYADQATAKEQANAE